MWRKESRPPDVRLNQDPDTCQHNGGSSTYPLDGELITRCHECDSTFARPLPPYWATD